MTIRTKHARGGDRTSPRRHWLSHESHRRGRRLASLVLAAVLAGPALIGCGDKTPTNPVGAVLGSLRDTVNGVLQKAGTEGQVLLVTAAGQVGLAINNAESAFAADLNTSIDKVDDSVRRSLDNLQTLVEQLQSGSVEVVDQAVNGAQQLINSLPFANKNPQVRSYSPRVVAATSTDTVQVSVDGNFFWASQHKLDVTLQAGDASYKATEVTTARVGFSIPRSVFKTSTDKLNHISMELTAPYEKGVVFKSRPVGVFRLLVSVLPAAPTRKVTLTNDVPVTGTEYRTITAPAGASVDGGGWSLRSWEGCRDKEDSHTIGADLGWIIDVSSVKPGYSMRTPTDLDAWADVDSLEPTGFVVTGHTVAHCFLGISNGSGSLTYFVTYTQHRTTHSTSTQERTLPPVGWGDQQVLPVVRGKWRVHAELWDGTVVESAGTSNNNPYLSIDDQGDYVRISAVVPSRIAGW